MGRTISVHADILFSYISTHSPRVGRTTTVAAAATATSNFNSLAPCGANLGDVFTRIDRNGISTHSPRVGRTALFCSAFVTLSKFQLTRPVWGEPSITAQLVDEYGISTHSPRVGRTLPFAVIDKKTGNFNSLAPCGANQAFRL